MKRITQRGRKTIKQCEYCGEDFETLMTRVRAGKSKYCSKKCYHDHMRQNSPITDKKLANVYYQKKTKYGLTKEEYLIKFDEQNNSCAICHRSFDDIRACVDHNHSNSLVRGLLCDKCNMGLGSFNDNVELLESAINYLRVHKL